MQAWAVCVWRSRAALLREREAGGAGGGESEGEQVQGRCGEAEDATSSAVCGRGSPIGTLFSLWVDDGDASCIDPQADMHASSSSYDLQVDASCIDSQAPSATANPDRTLLPWSLSEPSRLEVRDLCSP